MREIEKKEKRKKEKREKEKNVERLIEREKR